MGITIAAYAIQILSMLPALLKAGADVVAFVEQGNAVITAAQAENRNISDAEWAALDAFVDQQRKLAQS